MTKEFAEWVDENAIWMPDSDAMMFDVWNSILKFTSKSRTCESCEYCSKFDATLSYNGLRCDFGLGTINEYGSIFTELDFGCNKWKKK